jgi:hypothetical protein
MSKKTYTATITFEYEAEEGAPLTGKPITHPDHAIDAVRDELEAMSPHEFIIEATEYVDGVKTYSVKG